MKALGIVVNIFLPGIGTLFVGKVAQGIVQFMLWLFGVLINITGFGMIIGVPLCFTMWLWALISAATAQTQPMQVTIINQNPPAAR